MSTTFHESRPRGEVQRLGYLERLADDLASAWYAGFVSNLPYWQCGAEKCFEMHENFRRRAARFRVLRTAAIRRRVIASQRVCRA